MKICLLQCFIAVIKVITTGFRVIAIAVIIILEVKFLAKIVVIVILGELDLEEVFSFFVFAIIDYYP